MVRLVPPSNHVWFQQKLKGSSLSEPDIYARPTPNRSLQWSIRIQEAYEQERPILIISSDTVRLNQFCGYIQRIDPEERWILLINGSMRQKISLQKVIHIEVVS